MKPLHFILIALLLCAPTWAAESPAPEAAARAIGLIRTLRLHVEGVEPLDERGLVRLRRKLEAAAEPAPMNELVEHALVLGLLHMDGFREDLAFLGTATGTAEGASRLEEVGAPFRQFALALAESAERLEPMGRTAIDDLQEATRGVILRQDAFYRGTQVTERVLWLVHSVLVASASFAGVLQFQDLIEIHQMTPREFITFVGGILGANAASYWLIWDHFKYIEPLRKLTNSGHWNALIQAWKQFTLQMPSITTKIAGAAADDKPLNATTHADAAADAVLEALIENPSPEATERLKESLASSLEDGIHWRANRVLDALAKRLPAQNYGPIQEGIKRVNQIRARMERKSLLYQLRKCAFRGSLLLLAIWGFNATVKATSPEHLARWRSIPTAVLGAIGGKRIFPFLWTQYDVEALKVRTKQDEAELRAALEDLMVLDPKGDIVSWLARYDSKVAAHQLVTRSATDVLAVRHTGEVTMNMWRILGTDMARSTYSGNRLQYLVGAVFVQQRACADRLLAAIRLLPR